MIVKVIKSNLLSLRYEYLDDLGMNLKKNQSFSFLPVSTSDEDFFTVAKQISDALRAPAKSIEQSTTTIFMEA
ncbi:MAG: hypothetical protein FWC47_06115 [Oscillospiraceae bacterium]|nr:hypothetical protein [Oscillospiraceae bacterium]